MNEPPDPDRPRLSRRALVRGKFWQAISNQQTATGPQETKGPRDATVPEGSTTCGNEPVRQTPPLHPAQAMRYPKTSQDLDTQSEQTSTERTIASTDAAMRRRTIPILRPPGAVAEEDFLRRCTRCEDCVKACPHDAITFAPERLREAVGTPMLDPDQQPCLMCEDFPCIRACDTGALTPGIPKAMGTARITEHLCMAYHGSVCSVCHERCVVEGAIDVVDDRPVIRENECTGCGVCRYVCPAPENAILLMPTFVRPSPDNGV